MEMKKTSRANLEKERPTFFLLGFTVALATLFVLLEWSSKKDFSSDLAGLISLYMENSLPSEELSIQMPGESTLPIENQKKKEEQPVVYEDFSPVEEILVEEQDIITHLFEENASAQLSELMHEEILNELEENKIYISVDTMPQFPGGINELHRFLFKNTVYPASAISLRKQGQVWCSFIVNSDGSITDIHVEKGVYISLDQEAVKVLQAMPNWKPGVRNGKPVRVKCYLPFVFRL